MTFTSWQYVFFLGAVVLLYWQLKLRSRLVLLLVASYAFYGMWDMRFLALLMTSTCIDFYCGRALVGERVKFWQVLCTALSPLFWLMLCTFVPGLQLVISPAILGCAAAFPLIFVGLYELLWRLPGARQRKAFLLLSILTNLAALGFFKYFGFFASSLLALLHQLGVEPGWVIPHVILPVAISFYTFQSICYSTDIYQGKAEPSRDLLTFGAYLSFFPQLIAGPIERPRHLLPQFTRLATWDWEHIHQGLRLLLVGVFKKIFVADNCALLANYAFDPHTKLNAPWALLGVLAFAFQIYGDFSGYTDMARGSARLLGIRLSENFHLPYVARGPSDFWQRWHITLSTWFRDYVYIPLGGNRLGKVRTLINLWITMLLAGLWHGASWTFVLWGGYHAALLTLYRFSPLLGNLEADVQASRLKRAGAITLMFCFTLVGWAIFRAQNLQEFGAWITALGHWGPALPWLKPAAWLAIHVTPLLLLQLATRQQKDEAELDHLPWPLRGLIFILLFLLFTASMSSEQEFIYFQF